jgi:hypothetical protein
MRVNNEATTWFETQRQGSGRMFVPSLSWQMHCPEWVRGAVRIVRNVALEPARPLQAAVLCRNTHAPFLSAFPYVCPEPVLVK